MKNEIQEEVIIRYLCDELSSSEKEEFELLLNTDDSFRKKYGEIEFAWKMSAISSYNHEEDWQSIRNKIGFAEVKERSLLNFLVRVAAVFVLVFAVSAGLWVYWNVPGYGRWVVFETGAATDSIVLPDESIVFLNRNSSLTFRNAFAGDERKVALVGEGYFEVAHNEMKPFNVEIGAVSVKVVGTAFNLNATNSDGIELNVTHGKVILENANSHVFVEEGEWAVAGSGLITKGIIKNPNFLSWKTGFLEFNNTSLHETVQILNIQFAEIDTFRVDTESDILVTTRFKELPLPEIIEELSLHFQKKFTLNDGILIISD